MQVYRPLEARRAAQGSHEIDIDTGHPPCLVCYGATLVSTLAPCSTHVVVLIGVGRPGPHTGNCIVPDWCGLVRVIVDAACVLLCVARRLACLLIRSWPSTSSAVRRRPWRGWPARNQTLHL